MSAATRDASALFASALDLAVRVRRDLSELRRILDRVGSEGEADFVSEVEAEFEEFAAHLSDLKEKPARACTAPDSALQAVE